MAHSSGSLETVSTSPAAQLKKIPGEAGIWVFIFGDMIVFAVLFTFYLAERSKQRALFDLSQATLNKNFGAVNTMLLLISSLFVVLAVRAVRSARRQLAQRAILGAILCGIAFVVIKFFEYREMIVARETPSTNGFYMLYFVLTGLHLFHLIVGLVILAVLWFMARKTDHSKYQWASFEGGACFWHMVDMLWLVLFPLIFLVR